MTAPSLLVKWRFYDAIVRAPGLADLDRRLAFRFLDFYDPDRGGAWPSLDTLAGELSVSKRACIDAVDRLEAAGWFYCDRARGRGRSNLYRPAWENVKPTSPFEAEKVNATSPFVGENVNHASPFPAENVKPTSPFETGKGEVERQKKVKPTSPDSSYRIRLGDRDLFGVTAQCESAPPTSAPKKPKPADTTEADFADWYAAYPLKKDPKRAFAAYRKARKDGATAAELLEGAKRYATEMKAEGRERRFIKHPATWLAAGAWANEREEVPPASFDQQCRPTLQDAAARVFSDDPAAAAFREKFR